MSDAQYRKLEDALISLRREFNEYRNVNPLENSAIRAGRLRLIGGLLLIDSGGTLQVVGTANVAGIQRVTGRLEGSGVFDWSGAVWLRGSVMIPGNLTGVGTLLWSGLWEMRGNGDITGNVGIAGNLGVTGPATFGNTMTVNGLVNLNNDLHLGAAGQITVGPIVIDRNGAYGGRFTAPTMLFDTASALFTGLVTADSFFATGDITATGNLSVVGNSTVLGTKSFRMPHPLKDEHWLQHGCTESPISGTEYTGRATIGDDGSTVVNLPDYFEALNKPRNRTVQVTPVGRPFPVGADEVIDGKVTVYGEPGRDVFWLVKAERMGGDFETESAIPPAPVNYD